MDFWSRARSLAEEAAKKSQELTHELAQGIGSTNLSDVVLEASKRSKELAAEASKKSKEFAAEATKKSKDFAAEATKKSKDFAAEALKRADQITAQIPPAMLNRVDTSQQGNNVDVPEADLQMFGVTDELREFIKGITSTTFQDFPLEDDAEMSNTPTLSNVRQDLTKWQEKHAKLVLSTVKEISKLRYQLCPRVMKERKFWRIYFILVNSHLAPYEKQYTEDVKLKSAEKAKDIDLKESPSVETSSKTSDEGLKKQSSTAKSAISDQDLDVFLLGDLEDDDDGPGSSSDDANEGDDGFDDDFDKL